MAISHVLILNQATFPRLLEKILKGNEAKKKEEKKWERIKEKTQRAKQRMLYRQKIWEETGEGGG